MTPRADATTRPQVRVTHWNLRLRETYCPEEPQVRVTHWNLRLRETYCPYQCAQCQPRRQETP
jgi:hypothetical protein